jgi:hypothetical protein
VLIPVRDGCELFAIRPDAPSGSYGPVNRHLWRISHVE